MKISIDTHILLNVLFKKESLTKKDLAYILNDDNDIVVIGISLFEISLKYSLGKLELKGKLPKDLPPAILENGYSIEDTDPMIFSTFNDLPLTAHKDPFDRLIIWHSIKKGYHLLSHDTEFPQYRKFGLKLLK